MNIQIPKEKKGLYLFCIISIFQSAVLLLSSNQSFFWDTIQLASKHAHFYFEHGLSLQLLPEEFNSGHIPAFGYYLALCWTIFGKSLWVSHLSLLPFILIHAYALSKILARLDFSIIGLGFLFVLLDPTWLAQLTLVSPDIVLMAGLLLLVAGNLEKRRLWIMIAGVILALVSIRGIFCFAIYGLLSLVLYQDYKNRILDVLPAAAIVLFFYGFHFISEGWIGVHEESPWKESLTTIEPFKALKNIAIVFWRLIDFGRVLWAVPLVLLLFYQGRKKDSSLHFLSYYSISLFVGFLMLTSMFQSLTSHRYYLPIIQLGAILFLFLLADRYKKSLGHKLILLALILSQLVAHLIVYPRFIAQGWDASLAYLPAQTLFKEADHFIKDQNIVPEQVGTCFPLRGKQKYRTLQAEGVEYSDIDLEANQYIIYSNVMNDFTEHDYQKLQKQWEKVYDTKRRGIELTIFKKQR